LGLVSSSGAGGRGGGLSGHTLTVNGTVVDHNSTGKGGSGGVAIGGTGGDASGGNGNGGFGGPGVVEPSGSAGAGGGLAADGGNGSEAVNSTLSMNDVGAGGSGGIAVGGNGGDGVGTGDGGGGGAAIQDPSGGARGGGLLVGSDMVVRHVTISANSTGGAGSAGVAAGGSGGAGSPPGAAGASFGSPQGSVGGGGVATDGATTLQNTIVASNSGANCSGPITDGGHNLSFPDATCPGANGDPVLGALADNGGPTRTRALGAGSAALDQVPATGAGCAPTDQRGVARPQRSACDIGAYEVAPPTVVTGAANGVGPSTATLTGSVNPNLKASTYHFEYGTTTAYGTSTPDGSAGAGNSPVSVSAQVGGLSPNTTYHFRLVASNDDGTSVGGDGTFTTLSPEGDAAPVLGLRVTNKVFAVGRGPTPVTTVARKGTVFRYSLSEPARLRLRIQRVLPGRRKGRRCVKPTPALRNARRCKRFATKGVLRRSGAQGANRLKFTGRIGTRALKPGGYRAVGQATDAGGNRSNRARVGFRVVRR
jgi:hypothetical protein